MDSVHRLEMHSDLCQSAPLLSKLSRSVMMKKFDRCCISWSWLITGLLLVDPARAGGKPEVNFGLNIRSIESMKSDLLESLIPGAKWSQEGTFATCAYNVSAILSVIAAF